jgi:AraC-like DNA-binding protein
MLYLRHPPAPALAAHVAELWSLAETPLPAHAGTRLARSRPRWSQLAAASGYCDQSHLIRDFVAIAGESPTALLARSRDRVKDGHVALAAPATSDSSKTG